MSVFWNVKQFYKGYILCMCFSVTMFNKFIIIDVFSYVHYNNDQKYYIVNTIIPYEL